MTAPVKQLMRVVLIVKTVLGFSMGVYEATCGAYFYDRFGGSANSSTALMLAMILLAGRQGLITFLEMPTGALADTIGRVQVVVMSWVARTAFFFCLASMWFCESVSLSVAIAVVASIFWAICYTCFNGAFSAWCMDYLKEQAPEYPYSMLASYSQNYFIVAVAIGTPMGIFFYLWGYAALIYAVVGVLCSLCMGYCLANMKETHSIRFVERDRASMIVVMQTMSSRLWKSYNACYQRPILFWIVMTFGAYIFLLNIVEFLWPVFLKETKGAAQWSSIWISLAIGCNVASAIASHVFIWVSKKFNDIVNPERRLILFSMIFSGAAIISALAVVGHGYATAHKINNFSMLVVTVLSVVMSYGVLGACFEILINHYIGDANDQERATIISCGSFIRGVLFIFLAIPSAGSVATDSPIYWAIPASLLLVSAVVSFVMLAKSAKKEPLAGTTL